MEDKKSILIVEDDKYIINFITMSLKKAEYRYEAARSVQEAVSLFYANRPDLVILDLGLPDGDGIQVLKTIREQADTPVIVVSARQEEEEKICALDLGADDYVTKPFYMGELMARIRVGLRKRTGLLQKDKNHIFSCRELYVDFEQRLVRADGVQIHLTPIEFKILRLLIENKGKVLTHNYIMNQIWGNEQGVEPGNLRVFMAGLRRKIEKEPGTPRLLLTEVGVGYRFCGDNFEK